MENINMSLGRNRVEGFIASPINFSTYYNHVLQAEIDPLCNKTLVSLFARFAGDYFYSCNFSQDPGDYRYPGRESAWSTIVRSFLESPVSIQFVRDLSELFKACRHGSIESEREQILINRNMTVRNEVVSPQTFSPGLHVENKSHARTMSSFSVSEPNFHDSDSHFMTHQHEWQHETHPDLPKRKIRYGLTRTHTRTNRHEGAEKKKWKVRLCEGENCNKQPSYNWPGQKLRRFCADHRSPGMVDTGSRKCVHEGCMKQPFFNFKGQIRRFCAAHKAEGMINVVPSLACEYPACKTYPSFNFPGIKRPRFCAKHRLEGMVCPRVEKSKAGKVSCLVEGCKLQPYYNFEGENIPRYCTDHRQEGMVVPGRYKIHLCEHEDCSKASRYNFPGEKKRKFCEAHKQPGMVFVTNSPCEAENCTTRPRYNIKGEKKGRFCGQHKLDGMVDVTAAILGFCASADCDRPGFYRFTGEEKELFCLAHRQDGMVSIKGCRQNNCTEEPLFNFSGKQTALYCVLHKRKGMVQVDGNKRKCQYSMGNCTKSPLYNFTNLKVPKYCEDHKSEGMVETSKALSCIFAGCKTAATHAYEDETETPKHCSRHKLEGMVRIGICCKHPECKKSPVFNMKGERFGKFCATHKEPNMVRVVGGPSFQCAEEDCDAQKALFYFPHDTQRKFCNVHKQEGMIHGKQRLCQHTSCNKFPSFDFKGSKGKGLFCSDHKLDGMVSLAGKKTCSKPTCTKKAAFNFEGQKEGELFCSEHKLLGMVNVTGPKCGNEGCWRLALYNFEGETSKKFCILHRSENMVPVLKLSCVYDGCEAPAFSSSKNKAGLGVLCSLHQQGILLI